MTDYIVPKTSYLSPYEQHQFVSKIAEGKKVLFADFGDYLLVRTENQLDFDTQPTKTYAEKDVLFFELRACVGTKVRGKNFYFPVQDWRSRHEWLEKRAKDLGFELISITCSAEHAKIEKGQQVFTVDKTDFSGALKVIDAEKFLLALQQGIGNKGKAFGFGMLII